MKVAEDRMLKRVTSKILETSAKQDERAATKGEIPSPKSLPEKETRRPRKRTTQQDLMENSRAYADQQGH
jgi:hypothetical protein